MLPSDSHQLHSLLLQWGSGGGRVTQEAPTAAHAGQV